VFPALLGLALACWVAGPSVAAELSPEERTRAALEAGRLWPAEQAARQAVAARPGSAPAHQLLGRVLARRLHWPEALAAFEQARRLDPQLPGLDREQGRAHFALEEHAAAARWLRRAAERSPGDDALALELGLAELALGEYEAAARAFEQVARNPDLAQVALYNLGVARARAGRREQARDAFERAVILDPPSPIARRAWSQVEALERQQDERPWSVALGAGLAFDANVTRQEIDVQTDESDGAGRFELAATYQLPTGDLPDVELGYDFDQTLYFEANELDLQSHGFSGEVSERLGPVDGSFSYLFSLNRLDGNRFLDYHDIRTTAGFAPSESWYGSLSPAIQIKRFDDQPRRDAEQLSLGTLQLFALGGWHRYWLVGAGATLSDADGREFDLRELGAQTALHWSLPLGERHVPLDLRYRYRYRDYLHETPSIGRERQESIHSLRLRTEIAVRRRVSLRLEYEFEDSDSNLRSADYTDNVLTATLRYAM
jgi:tetratricopeptide (TPR) repeat protein